MQRLGLMALREQARSTVDLQRSEELRPPQSHVGASLLAMAVGQLMKRLDVTASSRASPLPQWIFSGQRNCARHNPMWERACSRWRWVS